MGKLTVEKLKEMSPNEVFASGTVKMHHPWYGSEGSDRICDANGMSRANWVAVRGGGYHDWAIYHSISHNLVTVDNNYMNDAHLKSSNTSIAQLGTKMTDLVMIQELVGCEDDALLLYRY